MENRSANVMFFWGFLLTTCSRTSFGTFLDTLVTFLAEEWEKMSGDLVTFRASLMVLDETWLMSTIMPNLFISLTIISPNPDKPLFKTGSLPPSASEESALSSKVSTYLGYGNTGRGVRGVFKRGVQN